MHIFSLFISITLKICWLRNYSHEDTYNFEHKVAILSHRTGSFLRLFFLFAPRERRKKSATWRPKKNALGKNMFRMRIVNRNDNPICTIFMQLCFKVSPIAKFFKLERGDFNVIFANFLILNCNWAPTHDLCALNLCIHFVISFTFRSPWYGCWFEFKLFFFIACQFTMFFFSCKRTRTTITEEYEHWTLYMDTDCMQRWGQCACYCILHNGIGILSVKRNKMLLKLMFNVFCILYFYMASFIGNFGVLVLVKSHFSFSLCHSYLIESHQTEYCDNIGPEKSVKIRHAQDADAQNDVCRDGNNEERRQYNSEIRKKIYGTYKW